MGTVLGIPVETIFENQGWSREGNGEKERQEPKFPAVLGMLWAEWTRKLCKVQWETRADQELISEGPCCEQEEVLVQYVEGIKELLPAPSKLCHLTCLSFVFPFNFPVIYIIIIVIIIITILTIWQALEISFHVVIYREWFNELHFPLENFITFRWVNIFFYFGST